MHVPRDTSVSRVILCSTCYMCDVLHVSTCYMCYAYDPCVNWVSDALYACSSRYMCATCVTWVLHVLRTIHMLCVLPEPYSESDTGVHSCVLSGKPGSTTGTSTYCTGKKHNGYTGTAVGEAGSC